MMNAKNCYVKYYVILIFTLPQFLVKLSSVPLAFSIAAQQKTVRVFDSLVRTVTVFGSLVSTSAIAGWH